MITSAFLWSTWKMRNDITTFAKTLATIVPGKKNLGSVVLLDGCLLLIEGKAPGTTQLSLN